MKHKSTKIVLGALVASLMLSGCITKSERTVYAAEELGEYEYVYITELSENTPEEIELVEGLEAVMDQAGLTLLNEGDERLANAQATEEILLAEYDVEEEKLVTIIDIVYSDYVSKKQVAYCRGTWGLDGHKDNLEFSEDNAINQTRYLFGLANEEDEFNKYSWY
ncbi:MAG: hypothetical protein PQJ59_03365 [Spirochaetales bacterium]|nr:hypothetical protein [Spirochaetales bacterium]